MTTLNKKQTRITTTGLDDSLVKLAENRSRGIASLDEIKEKEKKAKTESANQNSQNIEKQSIFNKINNLINNIQGIPLKEKIFFTQNLAIMLKAGLSLADALATISSQTNNKTFAKILTHIQDEVEKGVSFSSSLKRYQKVFGDLFISMVQSGEMSGRLEDVLKELHNQMKRDHELISKVRGALIYPAIVICAMIGIGILMVVFVLPKLTQVFKEVDIELPLPTRILIAISDFVATHGIVTGLVIITLLAILIKLFKTEKGKYYLHLSFIKLPILTPIVRKINLARFSHTLSSLLKTDIPIVESFKITAQTLGNLHYKNALKAVAEKIKKGQRIAECLKEYPHLFPPIITQMVVVGEESGSLDTVLEEIALFFEEDIDQIMKNLPSIIEPVLMLLLGVGVAGIAVSVLMPMYSMGQAF